MRFFILTGPFDFAHWQTVYYYFRQWKFEGEFEEVLGYLALLVRKQEGTAEKSQC